MKTVKIRDVVLGEGIPKICVPIVEETEEAILEAAEKLQGVTCDIVEWRADWFADVFDMDANLRVLKGLRERLGEKPVLFTFRTETEGGHQTIDEMVYKELLVETADSGLVDLIDVEAYLGDEDPQTKEVFEGNMVPADIIRRIHKKGIPVIASNHDFGKTPEKEELITRMCFMQDMGADICKIAVMPESRGDVLTLLAATEEMRSKYAKGPIVTMSMSGDGAVTRICGEVFGSAMTFGAAGKTSAPGQLDTEDLDRMLQVLHLSLKG